MIEQLEHFLGVVYDLRWILVLIVFAVLVFLWRAARFDEDVAVRALDMRADDAEAMRRELFLRDAVDGNLPSRWGR